MASKELTAGDVAAWITNNGVLVATERGEMTFLSAYTDFASGRLVLDVEDPGEYAKRSDDA